MRLPYIPQLLILFLLESTVKRFLQSSFSHPYLIYPRFSAYSSIPMLKLWLYYMLPRSLRLIANKLWNYYWGYLVFNYSYRTSSTSLCQPNTTNQTLKIFFDNVQQRATFLVFRPANSSSTDTIPRQVINISVYTFYIIHPDQEYQRCAGTAVSLFNRLSQAEHWQFP